MTVELNHTIVWCRDKQVSSRFLVDILGLPDPIEFGPMLVVELGNGVSLDFCERGSHGSVASQHYAFLTSEDQFDRMFARIREKGLPYWADPGRHRAGEIYTQNGGRGVYFDDPDGHVLEIMTQPYLLAR
ncbi:VOC family protein [Trinickia fusca]|uniref:VOC family protein n=1 Tax=Trinickia fusca TaxID=2419777 RepID=A0A494X1M4_9BURK|nr:VOC family protein [Trinickia fusca]RKP44628.1 VOC family protein [Trinickia fusca]